MGNVASFLNVTNDINLHGGMEAFNLMELVYNAELAWLNTSNIFLRTLLVYRSRIDQPSESRFNLWRLILT